MGPHRREVDEQDLLPWEHVSRKWQLDRAAKGARHRGRSRSPSRGMGQAGYDEPGVEPGPGGPPDPSLAPHTSSARTSHRRRATSRRPSAPTLADGLRPASADRCRPQPSARRAARGSRHSTPAPGSSRATPTTRICADCAKETGRVDTRPRTPRGPGPQDLRTPSGRALPAEGSAHGHSRPRTRCP